METIDYREQIPVRPTCYDVVVSGGGVAGVAAALTAARSGKQTLLIEKSNILGGLGTLGQVNLFVPMCNGRGTQIFFGLCEELAQLSRKYGWAQVPREWANGQPAEPTTVRYCVRYSPVKLKTADAAQVKKDIEEAVRAFGSDEKLCFSCVGIDESVPHGNVKQYLSVFRP